MKFKLSEILTFFIGFLIIGFIFWNRFLRVRLPKEILATDFIIQRLVIICLFIFFFILFIYNLYKIIAKKNSNKSFITKVNFYLSNSIYFNKILSFIINRIIRAPIFVYDEIYKRVYMRPLLEYIGINLSLKLDDYKKLFYFMTFVVPKMIVSICFFIDVILYKEFLYFYYSLWLLVIPLLSNIILFIIQHHAIKRKDYIEHFFLFTITDTKTFISFQPHLTAEERKFGLTVDCEAWFYFNLTCIFIEGFVNQINEIKNFYDPKVNILYYGIYLIASFMYVLILFGLY
jgi:hypothetical protein